jgi:hypothetical protein
MDGSGGHSSGGNGAHGQVRAEHGVSARKDPREAGGHRVRIGGDASGRDTQPFPLGEHTFDRLSDCGDHDGTWKGEVGALHRHGRAPAGSVRLAQGHPATREPKAHGGALEPDGGHEVVDVDALGCRALHLFHQARHFLPGTAIEDSHAGSQAESRSGAIHGGVPAAQHDHILADRRYSAGGDLLQKGDAG